MYQHRERLAALAAGLVGESEGLVVGYDGLEVKLDEYNAWLERSLNHDEGQIDGDSNADDVGTKGDRYVDFRMLKLYSTLSTRAKSLLARIPKVDVSGDIVRDDLGHISYIDGRQVAYTLLEVLKDSSSSTMMRDLEDAAKVYPWLGGLVRVLNDHPDERATVFANFKKSATTYAYVVYENGQYVTKIANTRAQGYSMMRDAGNNMRSGYIMEDTTSVYDNNGQIRSDIAERYSLVSERLKAISDIDRISTVENDGALRSPRNKYEELGGVAGIEEFLKDNPEFVETLALAARGIGFNISAREIKNAALQTINDKSAKYLLADKNQKNGRNKLSALVNNIISVYDRAIDVSKTADNTAERLYDTSSRELQRINSALALSLYDELEPRTLENNKTLSTYNNTNLIHQVMGDITKSNEMSDADYQTYLNNEWLQFEGFTLADGTPVGWLKALADDVTGTGMRRKFKLLDLTHFNHVEYAKLSPQQKLTATFMMWVRSVNEDNYSAYEVPIQADYENAWNFIQAPTYSKDRIIDMLADEVVMEYNRIVAIEERNLFDPEGKNGKRDYLKTYETQGRKFQIFPELNNNGFREKYESYEEGQTTQRDKFVKDQVREQLNKVIIRDFNTIADSKMLSNPVLKKVYSPNWKKENYFYTPNGDIESLDASAKAYLESFCANTFFARLQMTKLFTGDLSQFNGLLDYEKRNMLLHAPRTNLYVEAMWNGKRVMDRDYQNVIYLSDEKSKSAFVGQIKQMLKGLYEKKLITKSQLDRMSEAYEGIKCTDGQGFRTFDSYRAVMIMENMWDDKKEAAYQAIKNKYASKKDIELLVSDVYMQNMKPVATGYEVVEAAPLAGQKPVKATFLHKYSETVLLPMELLDYVPSLQSAQVGGLSLASAQMKDIDAFLFESCVKVGSHAKIDPFGFAKDKDTGKPILDENGNPVRKVNTKESAAEYITKSIKQDRFTVHKIPWKYYGIAASTPAHGEDDAISWSSQAEKEAKGNNLPGDMLTVGGKEMSNQDASNLYDSIVTASIARAYERLSDEFVDTDKLEKILQEELASKSYSSPELSIALRRLKTGDFALPMFMPSVQRGVEQILLSVIKKRLTRPKTKGANMLQVTSLGLDTDPFGAGNQVPESHKLGIEFDDKDNPTRIKWIDCYLPIHDSGFEIFADESGAISPERLKELVDTGVIPEDALQFVAYRTPSDDMHSILPLRIKGFLPKSAGANIIVSKEAMVMTGHDYDGDKLRCHFQSFRVRREGRWDEDLLRADYEKAIKNQDKEIAKFILNTDKDAKAPDTQEYSFEFFRKRMISRDNPDRDKYRIKDTRVVMNSYDYDKAPLENSQEARDNARVQIIFSMLTSPSGSKRMLIPGGCEETKIYAKAIYLTQAAHRDENVREALKKEGIDVTDSANLYSKLSAMDNEKLSILMDAVNGNETPFSVTHSLDAFKYMMGGAEMIGIYALYNSAAQMMQPLGLRYIPYLDSKKKPREVVLFGKQINNLFEVQNKDGKLASLALSRLLNAAVDNGKDPILGYLNQTPQLAEITNFLLAAGLSEEEVHLIINQPAVVALSQRLASRDSKGFSEDIDYIVSAILDKAYELQKYYLSKHTGKISTWYALDQLKSSDKNRFVRSMAVDYNEVLYSNDHEYADFQLAVLGMLKEISGAASDLTSFVRCTRPEAARGGLGTSISQTIVNVQRLDDLREKCLQTEENMGIRISGIWDIIKPRDISEGSSANAIMEACGDKMPQVVALNSLMMDGTLDMLSRFFPQAKQSWKDFATWIAGHYSYSNLQEGVVRRVGEEMILWRLLQDHNFIQDIEADRQDIVINVPVRLSELKNRIAKARKEWDDNHSVSDQGAAALINNTFLRKLEVYYNKEKDEKPRIKFNAGGPVVEGLTNRIRFDWANLMLNPDEDIRKLAIDLYKYNLFTNGFGFGMYEFAHFAPYNVISAVPGYIDAMRKLTGTDWDTKSEEAQNFLDQYYHNHWGDEKLVPQIDIDDYNNADAKMNAEIALRPYIVLNSKDSKGKTISTFHKVVPAENSRGFVLQKAVKTGFKNKYGQSFIQMNPEMESKDIVPIQPGPDFAWTSSDGNSLNAFANGNIKAEGQMSETEEIARLDSLGEGTTRRKTGYTFKSPDEAMRNMLGLEPIKNDFDKSAESANDANEKALSKEPETPLPQASLDSTGPQSPSFNGMTMDEIKNKPWYRGQASDDSPGQMYSIAEYAIDDKGKDVIEVKKYKSSPETVRLARKQKAYVELNKQLREILRRNGIAVGVLNHAEIEMSLNGIADFDTAKVVGEGLIEMIRIAEGYRGEYALPEEFSHVALEMLGHENPLVQRLLSALNSSEEGMQEAFNGKYDEYARLYSNNKEKLVLEAAGKLVGKQLLRNQEIQTSFLKRLVSRITDAIKAILRRLSHDEIRNAIYDADQAANQIARGLLDGDLLDILDRNDMQMSGVLYNAAADVSERKDIVSRLLKNAMKRRDMIVRRASFDKNAKNPALDKINAEIKTLDASIKTHKTESAILSYMSDSLDYLEKLDKALDETLERNAAKINVVCTHLNEIRDTLFGYSKIIQDVREAIVNKEIQNTDALESVINEVDGAVERFFRKYETVAMTYFEKTLAGVYGEGGKLMTAGKKRGQTVTIHDMARMADNDIDFFSRWFKSLADCGDLVLSAIDDIVRNAKMRSRERLRLVKPRIEQAIADLIRETGSRDQSFMFEKRRWDKEFDGIEDDGKLHKTGRYINRESQEYQNLNAAQKKFYDRMTAIKAEIDKCVPESLVTPDGIVMLRKFTEERVASANGLKEKGIEFWEGVRNSIMDTSDDIDFENYEVRVDFQGNRFDRLPLLYLKKGKKESYDDMTDDVANSILAYAGMGLEYNEMNSILATLENARYMAANRDVVQHTGWRTQRESVGEDADADFLYHQPFTVKQAQTRMQQVLDDFFQMHVYGHVQKNEGTIGKSKVSKRKTVNLANKLASYSQMAINLQQRISNVATGFSQVIIESAAGGSFNIKDVTWATREYIKQSGDRLMDTGRTESDNKLSLMREYFDVGQENGRNREQYRKGRMARTFNTSLLFAGLTVGEDYLSSITFLSAARNFKVKDENGKTHNLYDAYEIKYLDKTNKTGAYLELKKGWTKEDGSALTKQDEMEFSKRVAGMNFELQGIYNLDDRSAIQQYAFGSLIIMYRKWIAPALQRRYGKTRYSALRGQDVEGYWRTFGRFVADSIKNMKEEGDGIYNSFKMNYSKLTAYEKSNITRSLTEAGILVGTMLAIALLDNLEPPKDEDKQMARYLTWADNMLLYQALRLRNELGAMAPTPLMAKEALQILNSPFAAIRPMQSTLQGLRLLDPTSYFTEVKSGMYKGHTRAYKYFWNLPVLSMVKQWQHFKDPTDLINYYKNDSAI